jgi:septum formation protein
VPDTLVLASQSPQRRAILAALGVEFVVRAPSYAEVESGEAAAVALHNALGKARAVARASGEVVVGVDTVVSFDGRLWGKPETLEEARATLHALSGQTHTVLSGVAVRDGDSERTGTCETSVTFRALDHAVVEWYVRSGEWRERAGGYAIQGAGAALVAAIEGDWTNVVGLPVGTLLELVPGLLAARRKTR